MVGKIKVAVCGELPTACDFLLSQGVVQIDQYMHATEIAAETDYHLIQIKKVKMFYIVQIMRVQLVVLVFQN